MKKGLLIAAAALLLIIGAAGFFYIKGKRYEVIITQEQIDAALAEKFPSSKSFLLIFDITYSNPQVILLEETNRIQIGMDAALDIRIGKEPEKLGGGCVVTAGLDYNRKEQAFYLSDAKFEKLEIQGIPQKHLDKVKESAGTVARKLVDHLPVYRLKATDAKKSAAKLLLKDVAVQNGEIHISLGL